MNPLLSISDMFNYIKILRSARIRLFRKYGSFGLFCTILTYVITPCFAQVHPGERDHLGLAYQNSSNSIVLFGGNNVNENHRYTWNPTTWEWDGRDWRLVDDGTPGKVSSMGIVYDVASELLVTMGGINPEKGDLNETWLRTEDSWSLHKSIGPGARLSPAMAYDQLREEVVLFSGCVGNKYPSDTWIFKNMAWKKVSDSGPPGVCRAAMFYDEKIAKIILFGGITSDSHKSNRMWEWDGERWTEVDQGIIVPSGRANIQIAYDSFRKKAILFGGSGTDGILNDLWEWDGSSWTLIKQEADIPEARELYGITYHEELRKIFLYGGRIKFGYPMSDFWSWDGSNWQKIQN